MYHRGLLNTDFSNLRNAKIWKTRSPYPLLATFDEDNKEKRTPGDYTKKKRKEKKYA